MQAIVDRLLSHLAPSATAALPSAAASLAALQTMTSAQDEATTSASVSVSPAYRLFLTQRVLAIISHDTYTNVSDFQWVVSVLVDVAYISNVDVGAKVKHILLDIVGRVGSVRPFAVKTLEKALNDAHLRGRFDDKTGGDGLIEAAMWICGEYAEYVLVKHR